MSYKIDLSELAEVGAGARGTVTKRLVDFFAQRIEAGDLAAGDRLPTTRALAEAAGVNHLTAARAYRRLAEEGFVTASVGRGTFVSGRAAATAEPNSDEWQAYALPERRFSYAAEVLQDMLGLANQPGVISLAAGFPAQELHPVEQLSRITSQVFAEYGADAVSYSAPEGISELREQIASRGLVSGFAREAGEILITTGARQGIDLICRALLGPGEVGVVESPTFTGLLSSMQDTGARVIGVPYDEEGLDIEALERVLARHEIKVVAFQPVCQNPTGQTMTPDRRRRLIELARERSFFLLEDGVYATLDFGGEPPTRLRAEAPSHVVYVDSLSKTIGGGLRIGWVAAQGPLMARLATLKVEADTHSSTLDQYIAARYLASEMHDENIHAALPKYRERAKALMDALERHMPGEYHALPPKGGHHVWVTLRRAVPERALVSEALRHGVSFTPGGATLAEPSGQTSMRLSFGRLPPEELDEGVRRLARAVRSVRRYDRVAASTPS